MGNHYCIHLDETLGIFDMKVVFNVQSQLAYGASLVRPIKLEHPFNKQMTQENQQLNRSTNDQGFYKKTKNNGGEDAQLKRSNRTLKAPHQLITWSGDEKIKAIQIPSHCSFITNAISTPPLETCTMPIPTLNSITR